VEDVQQPAAPGTRPAPVRLARAARPPATPLATPATAAAVPAARWSLWDDPER
jgi:hypothetical protein